jgi:general secretion pathway protein M
MSLMTQWSARASAQLAGMTPRERMLLLVMAVVLGTGATLISCWLLMQRLWELEDSNEQRRAMIGELLERQDDFAQLAAERDRIEEQLSGSEVRLSTFIESKATAIGISRPNEYTDRQVQRDGGITMLETIAEFDRLSLSDLDQLMNSIEESEELVFIQGLTVAPARRSENRELTVEVNLATFKRSTGGSRD